MVDVRGFQSLRGAVSMNKNISYLITLVLAGSISAGPAVADRGYFHGGGHSHSGLAFGLGLSGGYSLGYFGRAPYLAYYGYPRGYGFTPWYGFGPVYGYGYPPIVVAPPPPVYIQQPQQLLPSQNQAPASNYWHYCRNPEGYYPYVINCAGDWLRVLPQPDQ
jgi:hypothetical protein